MNEPRDTAHQVPGQPEFTFHADVFVEFVDEDVKDNPDLRMKSVPLTPIILHPDALPGLDLK